MPLIKSTSKPAFKANVATEMKAGKPQNQALAIAYSIKRKRRAIGGSTFAGPIVSAVPGRTDNHPMDVGSGSYVLPSEHVASLGQGNTLAGMEFLKKIGPHGIKKLAGAPRGIKIPRIGLRKRADGGPAEIENAGAPVPIQAAGGEFVIPPEHVAIIGDGDLKKGHTLLDHWVMENRKKHIKTLKNLPPPAKD